MRKYRKNADSPVRVDYGIGLAVGLGFFPETQALVPSWTAVNDELHMSYNIRRGLKKPLTEKRSFFRFAHYQTDQLIRQAYRAAEIADGGRYGTICKAAFPDGVGPVVAPYGTRQIPPTEALVDRITKSKLPEMGGYRSEWLPKIEASLALLKAAADELKVARDAYLDAYRAEFALRSEHYRMLDKIMGLVRAAFPDDRAKQDLIFPDVEDDDTAAEAETEEAGQGDGG